MPKKKINLLVSHLYTGRLGNSYVLYDLKPVMAEVDPTHTIALHRDLSRKNKWVISHVSTGLKIRGGLDRATAKTFFYFLMKPDMIGLFRKIKSRRRIPKALRDIIGKEWKIEDGESSQDNQDQM